MKKGTFSFLELLPTFLLFFFSFVFVSPRRKLETDYESLQERLSTLPDKLSYDIMVNKKCAAFVCFCLRLYFLNSCVIYRIFVHILSLLNN